MAGANTRLTATVRCGIDDCYNVVRSAAASRDGDVRECYPPQVHHSKVPTPVRRRRLFIGTTEIGHLHGNGLLDLFVGKSFRTEQVRRGRALPHHVFPDSGWISFWLKSPADIAQALELFEIASMYRTSRQLTSQVRV